MQVSMAAGLTPPNSMGRHVQYTPFSVEQPFILSQDMLHGKTVKQQLPPLTFAIYVQSEVLLSSLWSPVMTILLEIANQEGSDPSSDWIELVANAKFRHNLASVPAYENDGDVLQNGAMRLHPNTEYIADNIILAQFGSIFPLHHKPNDVFLLHIEASILPLEARSFKPQVAGLAIAWGINFSVAFDRPNVPQNGSQKNVTASQQRPHAKSVSHKMCESVTQHVPEANISHYDAEMRVLSIWFEHSAGIVSMSVLSASVTHDRHGLAVVEFLVWFEADGMCDACESLPNLKLNLSCSVFGHVVPARIETQSHTKPRESVVTCSFKSSAFSMNDRTVSVTLMDPSLNLKAQVPFCSLQRDRHIHRIVACSQSIYNADLLEARWPGVLQAWVLYHASAVLAPR
jgi:hypothetical protein